MKNTMKGLVISAAMAASVLAASTQAMAYTQYVQTNMNFRQSPSYTGTIIGSVPAGAKVDVQGLQGEWNRINYNGVVGYIHAGNLGDSYVAAYNNYSTPTYTQPTQPSAGSNLQAGSSKTVSVSSGHLALRTAPCFDYANEIGKLYTGDVVTINGGTSNGYVVVFSPKLGMSGWVNASYLF